MQFTPSSKAKWTEDFNKLLIKHNETERISRNAFVEKCIELGVELLKMGYDSPSSLVNDQDGVFISLDGLNESQRMFLSSEEGKTVIKGIVKMLFLGNHQAAIETFKTPVQHIPKILEEEPQEKIKSEPKSIASLVNRARKFGGVSI